MERRGNVASFKHPEWSEAAKKKHEKHGENFYSLHRIPNEYVPTSHQTPYKFGNKLGLFILLFVLIKIPEGPEISSPLFLNYRVTQKSPNQLVALTFKYSVNFYVIY
jgi:hypothetical protein